MQNQERSRVGRPQGPKTGSLEDKEESPGRGLWWLLRCYRLQKSGQGLCNWLRLSRPWESATVEKGQCWWRVKGPRRGLGLRSPQDTHRHTQTLPSQQGLSPPTGDGQMLGMDRHPAREGLQPRWEPLLVLRPPPDTAYVRALGWSRERGRCLSIPLRENWLHDVYGKLQFSTSIQVLLCLIIHNTVWGGERGGSI